MVEWFIIGIFVGAIGILVVPKLLRRAKKNIQAWHKNIQVEHFLKYQVNYYKPIKKGTYPKEEELPEENKR